MKYQEASGRYSLFKTLILGHNIMEKQNIISAFEVFAVFLISQFIKNHFLESWNVLSEPKMTQKR